MSEYKLLVSFRSLLLVGGVITGNSPLFSFRSKVYLRFRQLMTSTPFRLSLHLSEIKIVPDV